jgi:hypothetical protein
VGVLRPGLGRPQRDAGNPGSDDAENLATVHGEISAKNWWKEATASMRILRSGSSVRHTQTLGGLQIAPELSGGLLTWREAGQKESAALRPDSASSAVNRLRLRK